MNMSATVLIPKHLARHFNSKSQIDVEASDLKTALEIISRDYDLMDILLTIDGHLQFIRIVIDKDLVTSGKAGDLAQVGVAGKTVHILTAFAGG
jgi:hypothetical protein